MLIRERMPYPLVVLSPSQIITYQEYRENTEAVKRFYQNQDFSQLGLRVDFSTEDGQKRFLVRKKEVLNKMIEDEALRKIAQDEGIVVTKDMAREGVKRSLDEYGTSERVQSDLDRLYGFTLAEFEEKVVMPKLYQEKLVAFFEKTTEPNTGAKAKIETAKKSLDQGKSFADVAKEASEGETRSEGGSLGWFKPSDLAPELQSVIPSQTVGIPGSVIETDLGYHIVLLEEIKKEENKTLYRISQIFTRKALFTDWLTERMQNISFYVLSPEYRFNREEAQVEFKSEKMREFEKNLYNNAEGDALFLF
jgi:parvulin-like peptidyl-prolyl isomerase